MKALADRSLAPHRERMAEAAGQTETLLMRYDVLETTADEFITDAVRESAQADISFSNGFRFGVPIPPANVTKADLWNLLPMDARMKAGFVTGKELKAYLENELIRKIRGNSMAAGDRERPGWNLFSTPWPSKASASFRSRSMAATSKTRSATGSRAVRGKASPWM